MAGAAASVLLVAVLVTMGLDTEFWNISWIVGVPWLGLVTLAYFAWKRVSYCPLSSLRMSARSFPWCPLWSLNHFPSHRPSMESVGVGCAAAAFQSRLNVEHPLKTSSAASATP